MEFNEANVFAVKYKTQALIEERIELYNAVLDSPEGHVVEVGSASGGTTVILLAAAEKVDKIVISIDPYPEEYEGKVIHYTPGIMKELKTLFFRNILENPLWGGRVCQVQRRTNECIDKLPEKLSVVFIDGCHEYDQAKEEFDLLFPRVVKGGYIAVHDVNWNEGQISREKEGAIANMVSEFDTSEKFSLVKLINGNMIIGKKK